MKKVLALVLTLAMLVGSLAVGLSAAFEFTATEDGDKFENVYSVPLESTAGRVTYFNVKSATSHNRNLRFDLWFENADGRIGNNFGCSTFPLVTTEKIGVMANGTEYTLPFHFDVMQKYDVQLRTGGAPDGKTNVIINGETIGAVDGQLATGDIYCGAAGVLMDNIKLTDGLDTQTDIDFDGTYRNGDNYEDCVHVSALEFRRDLGKKHMTHSSEQEVCYNVEISKIFGEDAVKKGETHTYSDVMMEFDISFASENAYIESWGSKAPSIYADGRIGCGHKDTYRVSTDAFKVDEWYHVKFISTGNKTEFFVDGVKVGETATALTFNDPEENRDTGFWTSYFLGNIKVDNIHITGVVDGAAKVAVQTFEDGGENYFHKDCMPTIADYVGKEVDIFGNITTYSVEGEAILIEAVRNAAKDPSKDENALYMTTEHNAGAVPTNYIINFDLALYPDKEGTISSDKLKDGAWVEFIVNKFVGGDETRVKVGNKFVGKNKDLVYYGEGNDLQVWNPGEFHNVTIQVANGSVTVYIDKVKLYSAPTGMDNWDNIFVWYTDNTNAVIDNYLVYDAKTFEKKVDTFKVDVGEDYVKTIADVNAENFCEVNGHVYSWARKADPKCYENGVNTYKCWNCDFAEDKSEVAKLEHKYADYDINRVDAENSSLIYTHCKTSAGCSERKYVKLPTAEEYQGELKFYHDFQDDFMKVTADAWGFDAIEDGVAKYIKTDANYNQINLGRDFSAAELNDGFKIGFDFSVDGVYDTNDAAQYGHSFDFQIGGLIGGQGAATIKYNMDDQRFCIQATNKNFPTTYSKEYPLVPGEVYNLEVAFAVNDDEQIGELSVYVNGQKVLYANEDNVWEYMMYESDSSIDYILMHVFGVKLNMDNFVIGDYDFAWNRAYAGDVDGDYAITVADALLMRKYLAKIVDMDALYQSRADVNGDGYVDAIDQLRIRKALAE